MKRTLSPQDVSSFSHHVQTTHQSLVIVGGCFDLLHRGHISFLEHAKKTGDILLVLLESDEAIKHRKGDRRPKENQKDRAIKLLELPFVDAVLLLEGIPSDLEYDSLVTSLKPAIIATTKGDPYRHHKERQAVTIGAKVKDVIERLDGYSTTNLVRTTHE